MTTARITAETADEITNIIAAAPVWTPPQQAEEFTATDQPQAAMYAPTAKASDMIILPSASVTITEAAEQIFSKIPKRKTLFRRGGIVMRLTSGEGGELRLDVVKPVAFRSMLESVGKLYAWRSDNRGNPKLVQTRCPEETAAALLACEKSELLPPVRGIVNNPVIANDNGNVRILTRGYHATNGGVLVTGGTTPSSMNTAEAVALLSALLSEFDFSTSGDRSRALASCITPALRLGGWIDGHIPADVAEADQSQSGKTYRQRIVFAIYGEKPYLISRKDGGVGGIDESVGEAIIAGRPFIQLDNLRGKLDSQYIEAMLTADGSMSIRVPHKGSVLVDTRHFMLFLTSNGVETTRDFANRSNIIRIRKREGYNFQAYPEGDLLAHVRANQSRYLGAVFAIIRAWAEAGKPTVRETRHDFREWAGALGWIVEHIFSAAPLMDGHQSAQQRVSSPALTWLRLVVLAVAKDQRLGEELRAATIVELCEEHEISIPGKHGDTEEALRKQAGTMLKRAFEDKTRLSIDGYQVERREAEEHSESEGRNRIAKSYVVTIETAQPPKTA